MHAGDGGLQFRGIGREVSHSGAEHGIFVRQRYDGAYAVFMQRAQRAPGRVFQIYYVRAQGTDQLRLIHR